MEVDFVKYKNLSFGLSAVAILALAFLLYFKDPNVGVDFVGGVICEVSLKDQSISDLKRRLGTGISIQEFEGGQSALVKAREEHWNNPEGILRQSQLCIGNVDYVGAQLSDDFVLRGIYALLLGFLGVYIYLWFRFDFAFGFSGVIALVHDALVTLGFIVISKLELNLTSVTAILTIIGYSVNDSVVIFDRIRENMKMRFPVDLKSCVNVAISSTLSRTLYTSFTTLLAAVTLIIFAGGQIREFSMIIVFGVIVGTYSSIFVSAPLYLLIKSSSMNKKTETIKYS